MRNLVTAVAATLALTMGVASPALADQNYPYQNNQNQGPYNNQNQGPYNQNQGPYNQGAQGPYNQGQGQYDDDSDYRYPQQGNRDRRYYDNYNFNQYSGTMDNWERSWRYDRRFEQQYRYKKQLSPKKVVRALAYQGYYGVRNLQKSRFGWDWRAFAFNRNGRPVIVRVNAFTGMVVDVRYL